MKLIEDMDWPPRPGEVSRQLSEWDAWYSGTRQKLGSVYAESRVRSSQLYGGLVGWGSRMLWGNPPTGSRDTRIHLPLAADIAASSADLLFAEELTIDWGEDKATAERMEQVLDGIGWTTLLSEAGEICAALGGVYLRAGWDTELADHPLASVVHADAAIPTFSFGILQELTLWHAEDVNTTTYRHTETHVPGRITHQLWKGSSGSLGKLVPLTEHPMTAGLVGSLDGSDWINTGTTALTAAYIPNIRPVPLWRHIPSAQYLGRSDWGAAGVDGLFDALDETWTSWMRDIRHGRSRILAATSVLKNDGPGQGAYFDLDQEIYEGLRVPLGEDPTISKLIQPQQFAIRVEEHSRTIKELTTAAVNSCGYSGSTFGLDTDVAKTATEVGAVRGRTRDTREKKTRYWTPALERFLFALMEVDRVHFGQPQREQPRVAFPPFASPTQLELAQTAQALKAAQAASTKTLVQMVHPDWDEDQVDEEVLLIGDENAPPPIAISGDFGQDAGEQPPQQQAPPPGE